MIWVRAGLLSVMVGLLVLAVTQTRLQSTSQSLGGETAVLAAGEPPPTRLPLPTALPQMVISRAARETPAPRATATPRAEPRVSIVDNGYMPAQQTLRVGEAVTWVNTGSDGHDVTGSGPGGTWQSGPLAPSDRYLRPFLLPGTYDYACSIHPEMRGWIVVQP